MSVEGEEGREGEGMDVEEGEDPGRSGEELAGRGAATEAEATGPALPEGGVEADDPPEGAQTAAEAEAAAPPEGGDAPHTCPGSGGRDR